MKNSKYKYVGKSMVRIDARDKVTGRTDFIKDLNFPRMLYAKMVLSHGPHAKIIGINTSKAKRIKGVNTVLTGKDVLGNKQVGLIIPDQPLFATKKVRYVGDCVALVVADSEEIADRAAADVELDLKPMKALYSARKSFLSKRLKIHPDGNVVSHLKLRKGNHISPLKGADVIAKAEFKTPHQEHAYLETLGTVAVPHKDGSITIYGSIQCPYYVQRSISETLGINYNKRRPSASARRTESRHILSACCRPSSQSRIELRAPHTPLCRAR